MKDIVLKKLTMTNFRGANRVTEFDQNLTTISGRNGSGKSRHFDAFLWCLFGKDSEERNDFNIRTEKNGEPLHKIECSVEIVLQVDAEEIILKRVFNEKWQKAKGCSQEVLKGNETLCYYNNVPVSVTEYKKRINGIIDERYFKLLSYPGEFMNLHWEKRREILFELAGTLSDENIIEQNPEYSDILELIHNKSLSDVMRETKATMKKLKEAISEIGPRIKQESLRMPEAEDFDKLRAKKQEIEEQMERNNKILADRSEQSKLFYQDEENKRKRINEIRNKQNQLLLDAQDAEIERVKECNKEYSELMSRISEKTTRINLLLNEMEATERLIERLKNELIGVQNELSLKRQEYVKIDSEQFVSLSNGICPMTKLPYCQTMLIAEENDLQKKQMQFNENKLINKAKITEEGKKLNDAILKLKETIVENQEKAKNLSDELLDTENEKDNLLKESKNVRHETPVDIIPQDLPQWIEYENEINSLFASIELEPENKDTDEIQEQNKSLTYQRDLIILELNKEVELNKSLAEIERLKEEGKKLSQQLADCEKTEYHISQYNRIKVKELDNRINSMFTFVKFKLFDYTLDGNEIQICNAYVGDVNYGTVNKALKLNADLDIINTLCKIFGYATPVWIDNAESYNTFIDTKGQLIKLVVTTEDLTIN